jgi:hypothetical protein
VGLQLIGQTRHGRIPVTGCHVRACRREGEANARPNPVAAPVTRARLPSKILVMVMARGSGEGQLDAARRTRKDEEFSNQRGPATTRAVIDLMERTTHG